MKTGKKETNQNHQNEQSQKKRPRYSEDFKQGAVELSRERGVAKVAKDLGVSPGSIVMWRKKYPSSQNPRSNLKQPVNLSRKDKEIDRLKQELKWCEDLIETLKKSHAIMGEGLIKKNKQY